MSSPSQPPEVLQAFLDLYHATGCNMTATANQMGRSRSSLQHWKTQCRNAGMQPNLRPDTKPKLQIIIDELKAELAAVKCRLAKATRPNYTVRQSISRSEKIRLVCIGDAHDSPEIDKSRFEWFGKYIDRVKPDIVVQIGDFATLDSLNSNVGNETYFGKAKPTFISDMISFNTALQAMTTNFKPEKHVTLGNHERRIDFFENSSPEAYGMMQSELDSVLVNNGWTYSPYGFMQMYGGVGFVHCALNRLGKSFGGKNAEANIANEALHDIIVGHSHVERVHRGPKIGPGNYVQIVNAGTALPDGHIEEYARHALNGWAWGISDMTIKNGHIQDRHWIQMRSLEEMFT